MSSTRQRTGGRAWNRAQDEAALVRRGVVPSDLQDRDIDWWRDS